MDNVKLVCFDLDDTLIRGIHSVMYLAILNNRLKEHDVIQKKEDCGEWHFIEADHHRAKLAEGLNVTKIASEFSKVLKPLLNVKETIEVLQDNGIKCILITVGPKQVAEAARDFWGLDAGFGSDYEERNGLFTGEILNHIGDTGKVELLKKYCVEHQISPENCVAIGDGGSDIPLFEFCMNSIAINYSPSVEGIANHYLITDDLNSILRYITKE